MTKFKLFSLFSLLALTVQAQLIEIPNLHNENETFSYNEVINYYKQLADSSERAILIELGMSDAGLPIHALVATNTAISEENMDHLRNSRWVMAINNGIHPGESCGVDASLHFLNSYLWTPPSPNSNEMIVVIPMYNIGGALNRSCCTRANQDGPESQGFRGNARNFDLNRDLIKADTRNTLALYELFKRFDPEVFIDTHSTNGADYPYDMTLITSPWQKYPEAMHDILQRAENAIFAEMAETEYAMSPYVNVHGTPPNDGFPMFPEGAMYTTGYAALHGALAFVTEAHMLKPYDVRVEATREFIERMLSLGNEANFGQAIAGARDIARSQWNDRQVIDWEIDFTLADTLNFNTYAFEYVESEVTGGERLLYSDEIETIRLPYYNQLKPVTTIVVPREYYIPIGQWEIIDRFEAVGVEMARMEWSPDVEMLVRQFHIDSYELSDSPYEGHVRLENLDVSLTERTLPAGVYMKVSTDQDMGRYLQEALHPLAPSSFAAWNMFSAYLQQKEWYSDYVFEDTAKQLLEENDELRAAFESKLEEDSEFAENARAQLYYIYINSPYYEEEHMHLPYYQSWD